jgi:hypothetical protein
MTRPLPGATEVRELLENLLGRPVTVTPVDPPRASDVPTTLVSVYVDDKLQIAGVVGMDFSLTAYSSAAIGLVPPGGAEASIEDRKLSAMLGENAKEICNVLCSLINRPGLAHVRLYQTYLPGEQVPNDAGSHLLALGNRLDLLVDIRGYGNGKLSLSLAA